VKQGEVSREPAEQVLRAALLQSWAPRRYHRDHDRTALHRDHAAAERLVGIAIEVAHDDLVADPRQRHEPLTGPGPALRDTDPPRRGALADAAAIPGKREAHPTVLVELSRRGILDRKGFPESYDRRALRDFIAAVKSGAAEVSAPVYSHRAYDIVADDQVVVTRPDILIVEGLNVLQPATLRENDETALAVSDYFDVSIYVDADPAHVRSWYIERFLSLKASSFARPDSYFKPFSKLSDEDATARAGHIWDTINAPNLVQNIAPTRSRATIILLKGRDHSVESVRLRKL